MSIKFMGYHAGADVIKAYNNRSEYMELESFYEAVNSVGVGCSCCKRDVSVYAVGVNRLLLIKSEWLSICIECVSKLPEELVIFNLGSHGSPPVLRIKP